MGNESKKRSSDARDSHYVATNNERNTMKFALQNITNRTASNNPAGNHRNREFDRVKSGGDAETELIRFAIKPKFHGLGPRGFIRKRCLRDPSWRQREGSHRRTPLSFPEGGIRRWQCRIQDIGGESRPRHRNAWLYAGHSARSKRNGLSAARLAGFARNPHGVDHELSGNRPENRDVARPRRMSLKHAPRMLSPSLFPAIA